MFPGEINEHVIKLAAMIGSSEEPRYVEMQSQSKGAVSEYFPNVAKKISSEGGGGGQVLGRQIWQTLFRPLQH